MGFELNRIMKQYGVGTPGMATYTGTAAPSTELDTAYYAKTNPDLAAADITTPEKLRQHYTDFGKKEGRAAYDAAAFDEQTRKYNLDKESYDKYKTTYQNRLQNTPMYAQAQFQNYAAPSAAQTAQAALSGNTLTPEVATILMQRSMMDGSGVPTSEFNRYGGYDKVKALYDAGGGSYAKPTSPAQSNLPTKPVANTVADLYRMYLEREPEAGILGSAPASTRPNFMDEAQAELLYRNLGNQNLMDATGSYYGNQLKNPIYAAHGGSVHDLAAQYAIGGSVFRNPFRSQNEDSDYAKFMTQQQQAGAPTQFAEPPPNYDKIVQDAYGTLQGRTGMGTEANNIDQGGFDYWKSQLASGAIKPEDFRGAFSGATDQYMANNPEDKYTKQVQGFIPPHIANLYKEVLGRAPDTGGAAYWAKEFGDEVNADEMNAFIQAAQPEMKTRFTSSPFYRPESVGIFGNSGGGGGGGDNKLAKAAVNAGLSYVVGPTYDYANAARQLVQGDVPGAATSLVSGLTGGVSNVLKKFKFENGGPVKTHYQTAGPVKARYDYGSKEEEEDFARRFYTPSPDVVVSPVSMVELPKPVTTEPLAPIPAPVAAPAPKSVLTEIAAKNIKAEPMPATPAAAVAPVAVAPKPAVPFGDERLGNIQALLAAYGPKDSAYDAELKAARTSAKAESDAFANMLKTAMSSPEDAQSSKAEMYFRLAAAFGAPTKTGQFSENLGMVGKELGEYAKGKRASAREKLALGLEAQKLKMAASKEDLNTLRALSAEEMKDKRTIATELIKDYIKSGEPQSSAGKQALDEGLKPGTPAYQKRVAEIGNLNVEGKMAQIAASLANVQTTAAQLSLAQNKFENQKQQQAKLTGPELKLKVEAEDLIASSKQSLADLKQAYALNPNSLAGGWLDKGQQFLAEAAGSKDPVIVNTRVLNNLLGSQGLAKLRATFGGSPTEGERAILLELEGIGAKTKDERGQIIKRAYKVLQDRQAREQSRLDAINSGAYRTTTPLEGGTD